MALWTPAEILTRLWLDASDSSTITIVTGVSEWRDKSGNSSHASQNTSGSQPTIVSAGLNGNDVIRFNATSQFFDINLSSSASDWDVFFVVKPNVATKESGMYIIDIQTGRLILASILAAGANVGCYVNGAWVGASAATTSAQVLSYSFNYLAGSNGSNIRRNGSVIDNFTYSSRLSLSTVATIGCSYNHLGAFYDGDIAEIIFIPSNTVPNIRQKIEGYLAWKWGLQSSLPVGHLYENAAPLIEAPPWTPSEISTDLWLDASDSSTITIATGVSQWLDKSGKNNHASQGSGTLQPIIISNGQNGLNIIRFDGSNDTLSHPLSITGESSSVFVVANKRSGGGAYAYYIGTSPANGQFKNNLLVNGGTTWGLYIGTPNMYSGGTIDTSFRIMCGLRGASNSYSVFTDGNLITSGTESGTYSDTNNRRWIGSDAGGTSYLSADVCEILIILGAISTTDRQLIEGYLAWKWDIQSGLPTEHPYKNAAPTITSGVAFPWIMC
jgi:hypothetical protein